MPASCNIRSLNENDSNRYGILTKLITIFSGIQESMEYFWSTFGALLEYFLGTFGVLSEHFWSTFGTLLEYFWGTFEYFWGTFEYFWRKLTCFKRYLLPTVRYPSRRPIKNGREMMRYRFGKELLVVVARLATCALSYDKNEATVIKTRLRWGTRSCPKVVQKYSTEYSK